MKTPTPTLIVRCTNNTLTQKNVRLLSEFRGKFELSNALTSDFSISFDGGSYQKVIGVSTFDSIDSLIEEVRSAEFLERYFDDKDLFEHRRFICQGFKVNDIKIPSILKAIKAIEDETNTKFVYISEDDSLIDTIVNELITMVETFDEDTLYLDDYFEHEEECLYEP